MAGDIYIVLILILLLLVTSVISQLRANVLMSRQVKRCKDIEDAVYRLIEITKQNQKNS